LRPIAKYKRTIWSNAAPKNEAASDRHIVRIAKEAVQIERAVRVVIECQIWRTLKKSANGQINVRSRTKRLCPQPVNVKCARTGVGGVRRERNHRTVHVREAVELLIA